MSALILSACATGDEGSGGATGQEEGTPPTAEVLGGRIPVVGTRTCERRVDSDEYAGDGSEVMRETFTCDTVMSDPRASGREVLHIETTFLEPEDVTSAWTGNGTLTNDEGSWTGTVQGVVDFGAGVTNYGEVSYVGQGPYEGMTLYLLVAGTNEQLTYAGWIDGSEVESSPAVEVLAGRMPVVGTDTCQRKVDSDEFLHDGSEVMRETFTCDLVMSDPRASGLDVWHIETMFLEPDDVTSAATGKGTLTNDEASWTATGEFAVDFTHGLANYGEEVYAGQGAYKGLTAHILIAGSNEQLSYAGWIEGSA